MKIDEKMKIDRKFIAKHIVIKDMGFFYRVELQVGQQAFGISYDSDTVKGANWMKKQFVTALAKLIEEHNNKEGK